MRESRTPGIEQGFDSRFDAAFQPGYTESDDDALRRLGFGAAGGDRAGGTGGAGHRSTDAEVVSAARRRHPMVDRFVIALWVVGLALTVLGILGLSNLLLGISRDVSQPTPAYMILVAVTQVSPFLIAIGLGTLVGTLFLLAVRWERRS